MNFDFVDVFVRAARITWRYKVLWIFGILAGCTRGNSGGGNNSNFNTGFDGSGVPKNPFTPEMMRQLEAISARMIDWLNHNQWILFVFFAFIFISLIIQPIFYFIGKAGLMRGVVQVENGAQSLRFDELLPESLKYFWRLFGVALIIWAPFYILLIIFTVGVFAFGVLPQLEDPTASGAGMVGGVILLAITMCCCALPVTIAMSLYNQMVSRTIVVEDEGILIALSKGWAVFSKNVGVLLIVGVLLFIVELVIGVIVSIPVYIPTAVVAQSFFQGDVNSWQPVINLFVFIICYTPVYWFAYGVLTTYRESVWTLSFLQFTRPVNGQVVFAQPVLDAPTE